MTNPIELLFLNDYFFYSAIAAFFFAFGAFCANEYNKHRYQEHFWRHLEARRALLNQINDLEQKQASDYVKNHVPLRNDGGSNGSV